MCGALVSNPTNYRRHDGALLHLRDEAGSLVPSVWTLRSFSVCRTLSSFFERSCSHVEPVPERVFRVPTMHAVSLH